MSKQRTLVASLDELQRGDRIVQRVPNDGRWLVEREVQIEYTLGKLPNRQGGFYHTHSGMTECGQAYISRPTNVWAPCKKLVNHDDACGYEDNTAF